MVNREGKVCGKRLGGCIVQKKPIRNNLN